MTLSRILTFTVLFALGGCAMPSGPRGFTQCGDLAECQPGQYCEDPVFSTCMAGCLSDVNCSDEQRCIKEPGESVGDCQSGATPNPNPNPNPEPNPTPDLSEECAEGCQTASFFCEDSSITPTEVSACDAWCREASTSDSQRQGFLTCVEAAFFTEPVCDERDCLP